jgi:hypothetical protein
MYKFTDKQSEVHNVEIDLRRDAELLTNEFGINVLYVRNCKFVRCSCFDDLNKTGDPNCKLCMGTGYFASIQKIKAIESSNSAYSSENSITSTSIGVTNQKNEVYYIRHQFNPKERDVILKVTWDKYGNPVDVLQVLEIINVYEMRGDKGRVELNGCLIDSRTDLVSSFNKMLSALPKKAVSQLIKGGKYIWPNKLLKD